MSETNKPSKAEDEYFAREELARRRRVAQEMSEKMAVEEKQRVKDLHYMKCPKCGMDLTSMDFHGVTVDHCDHCKGTWFDAGEVEKVLEGNEGVFSRVFSFLHK